MERLTKWLNDKKNLCIKECEKECVEKYTECHKCEPFKDVMKRLAEYEDAEEQGLLLRLPCKVGDTVYTPCAWGIESGVVGSIEIISDRVFVNNEHHSMIGEAHNIYLTKEEAELELANRQQPHAEAIMDERNGR